MSLSIGLSIQELLETVTKKKKQRRQQKLIQVLCKLCKSFYIFFFLLASGAVRNNRETWQLRGRPVKTIWRPGQRVPLSGTHCLPAIDSSTLFCSNFPCTPNLNLSSTYILFFPGIFPSLSLAFFLLNVKFLQTVLTVYRSALVISADVCCRCWNCQQREKEGEWSPKFGFNFGTYLAKVWIKSFVDAAFLLRSVENFHKGGSSFSGTSCVSDARRRRDEKKVIIFLSQAPMASWLASNQIELPNGKIKLCFIFVFLFGIWLLTAATFIFSWLQL